MKQIILDIETKNLFQDVPDRKLEALGVSVVGVYSYETDQYRAYTEEEFAELEQLLSSSDRIIGFNTHRFDFLVMQPCCKYLKMSSLASLDLLEELEKKLGHRVSLQSVARATLGAGKSGSGIEAVQFYRSGEWDKLKKYCLDDVRLTKEVYEFGKRNGLLHYLAKDGQTKLQVAVDWKDPVPPANLSLF